MHIRTLCGKVGTRDICGLCLGLADLELGPLEVLFLFTLPLGARRHDPCRQIASEPLLGLILYTESGC